MADQIPLKVIRTLGDTTALGEFEIGEEVGIVHGGTGADNAADARTNLGAVEEAPIDGMSYVRLNGAWSVDATVGDVVGPGSSTDEAIARFDGATGKLLQNSLVLINDTGSISGVENITLSGTVDGRDVALDGTNQDTHIADATIHFTEASIDHLNIANIGTNSHAQIDSHIADGTIHFTQAAISIPLSQINDVTATAAEVNLLDLAGLTAGWALIADTASTASWQQIDHLNLANIGSNTHAQIDSHIADASIHFVEGSIDHLNILNTGLNSHADIDVHIADTSIHFTEASIDHLNIANIGVNSHAQIDTHIADTSIHFADAPADAQDYVRNNNAWVVASAGGIPGGAVNSVQYNNAGSFDGFGSWNGSLLSVPGGLTLTSTTEGITFPRLTTIQRNALTDAEGLLVYDTDDDTIYQNDGSGWSIPGAGLTTLQNAYDNSLGANPMITLDGVPTPMSIEASVAGSILEIRDAGAANTIFEVDGDPDLVVARAGFTIDNAISNGGAAAAITMTDTTSVGAFVGGGIQSLGTITYTATTFIWALLQESKGYIANAGPGFAAFTLFNAIPFIRNGTNNGLVQALILNCGLSHQANGANAVTTTQTVGLSFSPNTRALSAFGSMTKTVGDTAVSVTPTHGTVNLSAIDHGTITGMRCRNPAVALFQSAAGTESMTAYYALRIDAIPFGGNVTKRGVYSELAAASNTRFIESVGTAESDHAGNFNLDSDFPNGLLRHGADPTSNYIQGWVGGTSQFFQQIAEPATSQIRHSSPAADRWLIEHALGQGEFNIRCDRFSLGQQAGANGNQVGNFVTPARTIGVAGEWADFLLTQGGNLTVDGNNMSRVSAWVINGVSYASSSGTVSNAETLTVGGFPTSAPGVTITERQSLHVIGGRSRFKSSLQFDPINPSALSSGDNDDWAGLLTGSANNGMRHWARVSGNADNTSTITGIDSGAAQDGDTFKLTNVDAGTITLTHQDTGSSASNRIITPDGNNYSLTENKTIEVVWDDATDRWRILTPAPQASFGLSGVWQFSSTTTMADPGAGEFRNNNATIGSVTAIAISDETKLGTDAGNILAALASGDRLYIQNSEDSNEFMIFDITSNTDNTGWHQIGGTVNASGGNFTDGKEFIVTAIFA